MTETGEKKTVFHPNENYFRHFREPLPSGAVLRGSGRPPVTPEKPAEYEKAEEGSVLSMGYGIAFHKEASDTGITSALTEAPGPDRAMKGQGKRTHPALKVHGAQPLLYGRSRGRTQGL